MDSFYRYIFFSFSDEKISSGHPTGKREKHRKLTLIKCRQHFPSPYLLMVTDCWQEINIFKNLTFRISEQKTCE